MEERVLEEENDVINDEVSVGNEGKEKVKMEIDEDVLIVKKF